MHRVWDAIRISRLMQAGVLLVILSGLAEACDQLGAVNLYSLPYIGPHAAAILAIAGVAKIALRFAVLIIGAESPRADADNKPLGPPPA